jgi:hypothetical protein
MAEGEKSLDQLIQLAMPVYYNWDITNREKDKRHHDLIAAPSDWGLYPELATMVYRRGISAEND